MGYFLNLKRVLTYLISFSILITVFYVNKISKSSKQITFINNEPKKIEILNTSLLGLEINNNAAIRIKQTKDTKLNNSIYQFYEIKTCEYQNETGNLIRN